MNDTSPSPRWTLRDLPFAARLTLAGFLISVGIGYVSALVQLHFQHATPGSMLPTPEDAVRKFHGGTKPLSRIEQLLTADENLPFNGSGQMRSAFTSRSEGWKSAIKKKAREMVKGRRDAKPNEADLEKAETALRAERETEKEALLAWIKSGANSLDLENDSFCLPPPLDKQPIDKRFAMEGPNGPSVKINSILQERCVSCHDKNGGRDAKAANLPLETFDQIKKYLKVESSSAMALDRLAQSTHVHLLGFAMLYMLTGVLFAMTRYPGFLRVVIAPLPLVAQMVDISFWWLARLDGPTGEMIARAIPISGAVVAVGLLIHIVGTLLDLFGKVGKIVLFVLLAVAAGGGYGLKERVIDKHLASEITANGAERK
jgi:hypothetical protein